MPFDANRNTFNVFYTWLPKGIPYCYLGRNSMTKMIRKVAHTLADQGQTEAGLAETLNEIKLLDAQRFWTLALIVPVPKAETVAFTLAELKACCPDHVHAAQKLKTLECALE